MTRRPPSSTLFPYTRSSDLSPSWSSHRAAPTAQPSASAPQRQAATPRSEEHTSELQSLRQLVCRLLLEKKKDAPWSSSPLRHSTRYSTPNGSTSPVCRNETR